MATIQTRTRADGTTAHRVSIRRAGYKIPTATFDTDEEARFYAASLEKRINERLDVTGGEITLASSVRVMLTKFLAEETPKKRGARSETHMLGVLIARFDVFNKSLAEFGPRDVDTIIHGRLTGNDDYAPVCGATVRREIGMLSGAFTHAIKKWQVALKVNPCSLCDRPKSSPHRTRRVSDAERAAVCATLDWKEGTTPTTVKHMVAWAFCFALETAMRRGEILGADWSQYDENECELFIPLSKNGAARNVPISDQARELLDLLPCKRSGLIVGVCANTFQNVWNNAKKGTPHEDLHFHDARHEATTRFADMVPTVLHLQAITGHKDLKSLQIYFNPKAKKLAGMISRPRLAIAA